MTKNPFFTVSVPRAQEVLPDLHQQVVQHNGRIELVSDDIDGASVIISKSELLSLERALAILSESQMVEQTEALLETMKNE
jgi:hypothetical protein